MTPAVLLALLLAMSGDEGGPVVVVPPEGPGGTGAGWIGAAVAETLPRALQRAGVPSVPGIDRQRAQEALGVPGGSATRATAIRVAESLGASRLVVGSWDLQGADLTLSLRLLDARRGTLSAPLVARGPLAGLGRAVHALAWDVALAGPRPPAGTREALMGARTACRSRRCGHSARGWPDATPPPGSPASAARWRSHPPTTRPRWRCHASWWTRAGSTRPARPPLACPGARPSPATRVFSTGWPCSALGRDREADVLFADLVAQQASAAALGNRAVARLRQGPAASGASTLLRQAVEAEPASVELPFDLGWALLVEGEADAAAFWLKGAVRRDPGDAQGRLLLSWALSRSGRRRRRRTSSGAPPPRSSRPSGRCASRTCRADWSACCRPSRVFSWTRRASADAEASRAHAAKGESLLASGDREGAVSELARAALLDPYATRPHLLLGRAYRLAGENEKALAELRMALWCRDDPVLRREIAELLRSMGRAEEARRVLGEPVTGPRAMMVEVTLLPSASSRCSWPRPPLRSRADPFARPLPPA